MSLPAGVRIDLVEDQAFTRLLAVERLQAAAGPDGRVRGFDSVEDLLAAGDRADVVVLDLQLEGGGVEGTAAVGLVCGSGRPVLVLSGLHSAEALERAQRAGAAGYVGKDTSSMEEVVYAIGEVLAGRSYVDPRLLARVGEAARKKLTARQQEVLRLEALGRTVGQIAREIELTEAGVRRHVEHLVEVYPECRKQTDRVRLALALGLVSPWEVYQRVERP